MATPIPQTVQSRLEDLVIQGNDLIEYAESLVDGSYVGVPPGVELYAQDVVRHLREMVKGATAMLETNNADALD